MVGDPSRVETIDTVGREVVIRRVDIVAELVDKGGFSHLTGPHDDLNSLTWFPHPALQDG
jgi:hypothetical protein